MGIGDVTITNCGEIGHVFTQEALELLLQLRAGARPDVVAFLDGGNDVFSAVQAGRAGIPLLERTRARDFELGRQVHSWQTDFASEAGVALRLGRIALDRVQLLRRFRPQAPPPIGPPSDSLAAEVVRTYVGTVAWVEALALHYGFETFYAWEPMLFTTGKRLSAFEQALTRALERDPANRRLREVRRLVPARLAPAAEVVVPGRFADLSRLLDRDSATAFVDEGHTTEAASAEVAAELARRLAPFLRSAPRRR
jgi:lysophospholipase L1-like esterase